MRDKLDSVLSSFSPAAAKEQLQGMLREAEDWLYSDEGEEASKSSYVAKLDGLKNIGLPIAARYKEADERPVAVKKLRESLGKFSDRAQSQEERFAHITEVRECTLLVGRDGTDAFEFRRSAKRHWSV